MNLATFHFKKLSVFVLLSLADLFLTSELLKNTEGSIYESNPLANAWLTSFGWTGLVVYKVIAMTVLMGVAVWLSVYKRRWAAEVLTFACVAVGMVVCYSCMLLSQAQQGVEPTDLDPSGALVYRHLGRMPIDLRVAFAHREIRQLTVGEALAATIHVPVSFKPDNAILGPGRAGGAVRLWNRPAATQLHELHKNQNGTAQVADLFDGKIWAAPGEDRPTGAALRATGQWPPALGSSFQVLTVARGTQMARLAVLAPETLAPRLSGPRSKTASPERDLERLGQILLQASTRLPGR